MASSQNSLNYSAAVRDFDRARKQAALHQLMSKLTGRSAELLSYNEVQEQLQAVGEIDRGLREIPLDAIVGSVGRYDDFTRGFLPKRDSDEERWARVRTAISDMHGMKPIEVYQVGDSYFVKDGNHRVSVARQLGVGTISAYVTEVKTRVELSVDDDPDEIICKARYVDFLEETDLDKVRPQANLLLTFCNQYDVLRRQIETRRQILNQEREQEVSTREVVSDWYDRVYLPVVELIREQGLLRNFPRRTEADLYLLFSERRAELEAALGWKIGSETAVTEFAKFESEQRRPMISRVGERLLDALVPDELYDGPEPGSWRESRVAYGRKDRLFADYLVAISGSEADWHTLDEVIKMAKLEDDHLLGLHVVAQEHLLDSSEVKLIRERFEQRCREETVAAEFAVEVGKVADTIVKRAALADLVVTTLSHRPGLERRSRLSHGFNRLVQKCPRPVLAVPEGAKIDMNRILLAYDGSAKADEALFVAAYLASRWPIALTVVTVETEYTSVVASEQARAYIEKYGIQDVTYVVRKKPIAEAILRTAEEHQCDTIIMGGFGFRPVLHLMMGSTVDQLLREFQHPMLICR